MDAVSLYLHIPFCRAKCAYCDFNSYPGLDHLFEKYVRALQREVRWVKSAQQIGATVPCRRGRSLKVNTIYLGGGTPTVLPPAFLGKVLDACREHFTIAEETEITVEANPGTVDGSYLAGLLEMGVNRLSLGAQSFCDDELRLLGRIHTAAQACHQVNPQMEIHSRLIRLLRGLSLGDGVFFCSGVLVSLVFFRCFRPPR